MSNVAIDLNALKSISTTVAYYKPGPHSAHHRIDPCVDNLILFFEDQL